MRRVDPPAASGSLGVNLSGAGDDVLATWVEPAGKAHRVRFSRFRNGSWSDTSTIAKGKDLLANWADFPSAAVRGDGELVAHWLSMTNQRSFAYDVMLARSRDGAEWQSLGRAHDDGTQAEHGFVSMMAEGDGARLVWLDGRETPEGPMQLRTAVLGDEIRDGTVIDDRVCDCCGTAMAMTSEGPVVVYRDRDEEEIRDIYVVRKVGAGWTEPRPVHADGWWVPGCPVNGPAIDATGRSVAVAWYTYADSRPRVRVAFSNDAGASFAKPIDVDVVEGRRAPIGRVALVLHRNEALVSWLASDREDATIFVRRVASDGRRSPPFVIAKTEAGRDAGFPRMNRVDDALLVAWTQPTEPSKVVASLVPLRRIPAPTSDDERPARPMASLAIGSPAPKLAAQALSGEARSLASLRGRVVLLNVWATWCEACRHEVGVLAGLQERFGADGLQVVGISVDREDAKAKVEAFVKKRKIPFEIWKDPQDEASAAFGIGVLPANFLFDRSARLVWKREGAIQEGDESLASAIQASLAAPKPPSPNTASAN